MLTTFKEDQKDPSDRILLIFKPNTTVDQNQTKAIRDFVSSAVEGLEPNNIEVFGNL